MKSLLWFLTGVAVGVAGIFFYEIFGKPVLPFDGKLSPASAVKEWDDKLVHGEMIF